MEDQQTFSTNLRPGSIDAFAPTLDFTKDIISVRISSSYSFGIRLVSARQQFMASGVDITAYMKNVAFAQPELAPGAIIVMSYFQ